MAGKCAAGPPGQLPAVLSVTYAQWLPQFMCKQGVVLLFILTDAIEGSMWVGQ